MKCLTYFLLSFIILTGCQPSIQNKKDKNREVYNAMGNQVFTVYANRSDQTMSVVYGNKLAIKGVRNGHFNARAGAELTIVTYQQDNNKYWYGSYINGGIISVEQLTMKPLKKGGAAWDYKLIRGRKALGPNAKVLPVSERIREISNKKPAIFL